MNYGTTAASSVPHYRTMKVTITEAAIDKNYFEYKSDDLWTSAIHEKVGYANGKTYTLFSITRDTLNNILKNRCNKTLEEKAAENSDGRATVYLQSSYMFLDGYGNLITDNGGKGFYNYQMAKAEANRESYSAGTYFTGYNVPISLEVPKRVDLYLQSYTSEAGSSPTQKEQRGTICGRF